MAKQRATTYTFGLVGADKLMARLERLAPAVRKRVLRPAVTAAARPIRQAAKRTAPVRFGILKKSLLVKTASYKETAVAIVGPASRKDFVRFVTTPKGRRIKVVPGNYAHLVELGTPRASPNPFLARAMALQQAAARAKLEQKIKEGLEKHA